MISFKLAVDDTDSLDGMCTTFLGSLLYFKLNQAHPLIKLLDFPYLIRLNPNIPYKTRGNGAVVITGLVSPSLISWLHTITLSIFSNWIHKNDPQTNPGLVICQGIIPQSVKNFANRALWDVIPKSELNSFKKYPNIYFYGINSKLGLIGALAAIGTDLSNQDHTFELLVYRYPPYKCERNPNKINVWRQEGKHQSIFNCVDIDNNSILIFPRGRDPVFCGIRGENPKALWSYWVSIQPQPQQSFWMIYRTNQATNAHLIETQINLINKIKYPYQVVKIKGKVKHYPNRLRGGHTSFLIEDSGKKIVCYAYEPTKQFRLIILQLIQGDIVEVSGAIRDQSERIPELTLNIEQIKIIKLEPYFIIQNPKCPKCFKRMKSAGKYQKYRCRKCKTTLSKEFIEKIKVLRKIKVNTLYLPAISAQRHLTKPISRYNLSQSDRTEDLNFPYWLKKIKMQKNFKS